MSLMTENFGSVRCDFDECGTSMTFRIVLAVVDQLCADADTDFTLLESLDLPLEDSIEELAPRSIEAASVTLSDDVLTIEFDLRFGDGLMDTLPFGDSGEVVESFFAVHVSDDPPRVRLTATLG